MFPSLRWTFEKMLLPALILKRRGLIKDSSLNLFEQTRFTTSIEKVVSSYCTQWTKVTPGSFAAKVFPSLTIRDVEFLCSYTSTSRKLKSTVTHGRRYLKGPDRRLGNIVHATQLESGCYIYALDSTASFGTVPRTGKRDYSIFITVAGCVIFTYCMCKNGRSGKC